MKALHPLMPLVMPLVLPVVLAGCASPRPPAVPHQLQPAANESLALIVAATGVQIYECRAKKEPAAGNEWAFVAPEADLLDARGNPAGRHYAGPHWEALDGSKTLGSVKQRADAPLAGAIPWLLLAARPTGPQGLFSPITSIQRVNTRGGVAPAAGCGPQTAGASARVAYTADYHFYRSNP